MVARAKKAKKEKAFLCAQRGWGWGVGAGWDLELMFIQIRRCNGQSRAERPGDPGPVFPRRFSCTLSCTREWLTAYLRNSPTWVM